MQSGERERAGSREQGVENNNYESTDWDIELHGGSARRRTVGACEDNEASRREVVGMAGDLIGRSRTASVYRQVRRSVDSRIEGGGVGVSFMAVGSLV